MMTAHPPIRKIDDYRWEIPKSYKPGMRVPGLIFATEEMMKSIRSDQAIEQVANVAHLPGIVRYSIAMPDIHWGYGFPIGGVAATDPKNGGVISPGGIGFDINCGVRLLRTDLREEQVRPRLRDLIGSLFTRVPCGVGVSGKIRIAGKETRKMLVRGARWAVEQGYGVAEDLEYTEASGVLEDADPDAVSERAYERGRDQLGTLGSGNHFLEVQVIDQILEPEIAERLELELGQITIMIHSGSRGFGYQVCDDYLHLMRQALGKYKISLPDQQLSCAPVNSPEGRRYLGAMRCAANYAWNNRQCLMSLTRDVFERCFGESWSSLGMRLIYDVAHNIAKFERYSVDGEERTLCIHRKGATRAFGPGAAELPEDYRDIGQPVIIPGDMGRNSYLAVGTAKAMTETFASSCHGAGRAMSRHASVRHARGRSIEKELEAKGIIVMGKGKKGIAEEQPAAYKDVNQVVDVVHQAGIIRKVVRMRPIGVIKG
ncbi:MAG: RtcB family protein [Candidatus Omnitrophota bacterium]|nr:RtcB family protein [Candidatus Omnitrophota bacterium]